MIDLKNTDFIQLTSLVNEILDLAILNSKTFNFKISRINKKGYINSLKYLLRNPSYSESTFFKRDLIFYYSPLNIICSIYSDNLLNPIVISVLNKLSNEEAESLKSKLISDHNNQKGETLHFEIHKFLVVAINQVLYLVILSYIINKKYERKLDLLKIVAHISRNSEVDLIHFKLRDIGLSYFCIQPFKDKNTTNLILPFLEDENFSGFSSEIEGVGCPYSYQSKLIFFNKTIEISEILFERLLKSKLDAIFAGVLTLNPSKIYSGEYDLFTGNFNVEIKNNYYLEK